MPHSIFMMLLEIKGEFMAIGSSAMLRRVLLSKANVAIA